MGARNLDRYSVDDWRACCPTVGHLIAARWEVLAVCRVCDLQLVADLPRIAREKGPNYRLWGRSGKCRRRYCIGTADFFVHPPGATTEIRMTDG